MCMYFAGSVTTICVYFVGVVAVAGVAGGPLGWHSRRRGFGVGAVVGAVVGRGWYQQATCELMRTSAPPRRCHGPFGTGSWTWTWPAARLFQSVAASTRALNISN